MLVIGSGNFVHNLRLFNFRDPKPLDWALRCDAEIRAHLSAGRHGALIDYPSRHSDARLAIPTPEHYLPLLYAIALQQRGETARLFNAAVLGSISMTSVLIGEPGEA